MLHIIRYFLYLLRLYSKKSISVCVIKIFQYPKFFKLKLRERYKIKIKNNFSSLKNIIIILIVESLKFKIIVVITVIMVRTYLRDISKKSGRRRIKDVATGKKRESLWRVIVVSRGCNSNYVGYPVPDLRGQPYMCTNHLHAIST